MPEIIVGAAHSSRDDILVDRIINAAQQGNALVIVPDQYSFETDSRLYASLGAALFNRIETAGISALCENICRSLGGNNRASADENSQLIAMYRAQSRLRNKGGMTFYKKSLLCPAFVSDCLTLISQLVKADASPETLRAAAERSNNVSLKLFDIAAIYQAYSEELEKMQLEETLSQNLQAARLALELDFFSGKRVFFDGFTSLSADELELVKAAVKSAKSVVFSLVFDECSGENPFAQTQKLLDRIKRISQDFGREVRITHADGCYQTPPLEHINRSYFSYNPSAVGSDGLVKTIATDDIYIESDYVCSEILRLVREEGMSFNDIAVICGNFEDCSRVLSSSAQRYDIPYYVDKIDTALNSVPAKYLTAVLDAVMTKKYRTENILRIVKSPLSPFFDYDACDLEEFCIKWNVEGDMWKSPFDKISENKRLEMTRKRIIDPLERFRQRSDKANADELCEALFELLDELEMSEQIYSAVKIASLDNETDYEITRSFKQVWLGFVGAVKSIYENMKGSLLSLRSFSELLGLMLSEIKISSPPQKSDCVRFAQAGRSRLYGVKALFIMQANDGVFPQDIKSSSVLSEEDISVLSASGIELEISALNQLDEERNNIYSAITVPTERLYVSYEISDRSGSASSPSQLPITVCKLFSDNVFVEASKLDEEFFSSSFRTAFYNYLEHSRDKTQSTANLRAALESSDEYSARLEFINECVKQTSDRLEAATAKKLFFPQELNLSATRVSDFYNCPFYYFCRHGLKLYPTQSVEIDSRYTGNIAHKCLERVMSVEVDGERVYDADFTKKTNEQLFKMINDCADEYVKNEMGGDFGKNSGFGLTLERLKKSILNMAINFREEMKDSLFLPMAFEYDLHDKDGKPVISVELDDVKINIHGIIDRADIYKTEYGSWLRIVDYKTGRQTFDEAEIYHGLDLQMLIYLLAAVKSGLGREQSLDPAGIMYSHIKYVAPVLTVEEARRLEESGELEQRMEIERAKSYKPDGEMLGEEIFRGLNKSHEGVYTIFKFKKDGELHGNSVKPISKEKLEAMELFALEKLADMANRLSQGDIAADPIMSNDVIRCTYCEYKGMCKNPNPLNPRTVSGDDKELLDEELEKIAEDKKMHPSM
ncbi:MAG: PD-(D/E)XK nuclease family protein [Ruminococcus sp.]|nr:PD-(D/E)XK nuclease family protein [Ruminococcus sp.]